MHQLLSSIAFLGLLALPLAAQDEALLGTWESRDDGEGTIRLTFQADGTCEINQVMQGDAFLAEAETAGVEIPDFTTITAHGTGTYQVEGDSISVNLVKINRFVDGEDLVEFFTQIARDLARLLAEELEVAEEDYPAFEQTFVEEFLGGLGEEEFPDSAVSGTYAIEGDTLFLTATDEEGGVETLELHRIDVASAVAPTSWGRLKAAWRP